jgi:hypothetical protein
MYVCMYVCVYVCMYVSVCMLCLCKYVCMCRYVCYVYVSLYVCMYVCMNVRLASAGMVRRIVLMFGIQEFVNHRSVPDECENSGIKIMVPSKDPSESKCRFYVKRM